MSCVVLDIEVADKNVIKELRVFVDGKIQGYPFRPPKNYKLIIQDLHGIVWNSGRFAYSELLNNLPRAKKGEYFA